MHKPISQTCGQNHKALGSSTNTYWEDEAVDRVEKSAQLLIRGVEPAGQFEMQWQGRVCVDHAWQLGNPIAVAATGDSPRPQIDNSGQPCYSPDWDDPSTCCFNPFDVACCNVGPGAGDSRVSRGTAVNMRFQYCCRVAMPLLFTLETHK